MQNQDSSQSLSDRIIFVVLLVPVFCGLYFLGGSFPRLLPKLGGQTLRSENVIVRRELPVSTDKYLDGADWQMSRKVGQAFTHWSFICKPQFSIASEKLENGKFRCTVKAIAVDLSLPITTWLPFSAAGDLKKHEDGHRVICERVYKDSAEVARHIAQEFLNRTIEVSAFSHTMAQTAVAKQMRVQFAREYDAESQGVADRVSQIYDDVTAHGTNKVSTANGIAQSFKIYTDEVKTDEAQPATMPLSPHSAGPQLSVPEIPALQPLAAQINTEAMKSAGAASNRASIGVSTQTASEKCGPLSPKPDVLESLKPGSGTANSMPGSVREIKGPAGSASQR